MTRDDAARGDLREMAREWVDTLKRWNGMDEIVNPLAALLAKVEGGAVRRCMKAMEQHSYAAREAAIHAAYPQHFEGDDDE